MAIRPVPLPAQSTSGFSAFLACHPEFIQRIAVLRKRRDRKLARLFSMPRRQQHGEARRLLRSGSLHLLYAFEAVKAKHQLHDATPQSIAALAARCDPFVRTNEPATRRYVRKGGKTRLIQDFGPMKRMHHLLVADLLRTLHPPRQDQFLLNGGMPMALKAVEDAFREGFTHAVEVDLIDFYGGVRPPGLADLLRPLPGAVTDHVVWDFSPRRGPDDDIAASCNEDSPSASGLVGLSLGAATSPVVGEVIIRHLLDTAQLGQVVAYADNILVLGRGSEDAAMRAAHLREVALGLETGPLAPRMSEPAGFRDKWNYVEFAGHWGRAIRHRLDWQPNERKQREHRIADQGSLISIDEIAEAERKVIHRRRAYPMWRTGDQWEVRRIAELAAARYYQDARPEHLTDARQKLIIAHLVCGRPDLRDFLPDGVVEHHRGRRMTLYRETLRMLEAMMQNNAFQAA